MLTTIILIIAPNCFSDGTPIALKHDLNYNNTGYESFIRTRYEVVRMGGVSINSIESVTLPLLRQVFPDNPIVFVYGEQHEWDYQLYVANKYGSQYYYKSVAGNADVNLGYAMASYNHVTIQHERAHLDLCAAHGKGSSHNDPATWTRTVVRPWCSGRH